MANNQVTDIERREQEALSFFRTDDGKRVLLDLSVELYMKMSTTDPSDFIFRKTDQRFKFKWKFCMEGVGNVWMIFDPVNDDGRHYLRCKDRTKRAFRELHGLENRDIVLYDRGTEEVIVEHGPFGDENSINSRSWPVRM